MGTTDSSQLTLAQRLLGELLKSLEREHAEAQAHLEETENPEALDTLDDLDPPSEEERLHVDAYWDGFAQGLWSAILSVRIAIGELECAEGDASVGA
uniref:Uncharacterized protein n=1 Tax=viral metagenome TaxID=1070528 RepID=A0A6H1Z8Y8_9ZZZZ